MYPSKEPFNELLYSYMYTAMFVPMFVTSSGNTRLTERQNASYESLYFFDTYEHPQKKAFAPLSAGFSKMTSHLQLGVIPD